MPRECLMMMLVLAATAVLWAAGARAGGRGITNTSASPHVKLKSVGLDDVKWTRGFWAGRFALCRDVTIPEMHRALQDHGNAAVLDNFRVAAGLEEGQHRGTNWSDGDCYKWIETMAHVYAVTGDEALDSLMDEWVEIIGRAQAPDGYISTNIQLTDKEPFTNPHHHELYNMGHLLTAACVHHRVTGKDSFLSIAKKLGDHLYATFQPRPPQLAHFGWNPSNIMGLVDLYRTTRDARYLELAGIFVDMRGSAPGGSDLTQDRVPLREETEAVGHCVCAGYLYCGAADVYAETGEKALWEALERLWQSVTTRKMYLTGAVGSFWRGKSSRGDSVHEAFGLDYELPSRTAYTETCANIANAMWNWRMLGLTGEAKYTDVMERVLYNSLLSGIGLEGKDFFYCNPLARDDSRDGLAKHHTPQRWSISGCYCCPPNVARTIAKLRRWAYSVSDEGVWVNLYGSSVLDTELLDGSRLKLTQETDYPWDGHVKLTVHQAKNDGFAVMLRIPAWVDRARIKINGKAFTGRLKPGQYAALRRKWSAGDAIELHLPMRPRLMQAHPAVQDLRGQVAVMRGPIVYCLESPDLPDGVSIQDVAIPADLELTARFEQDLLGGVTVLEGKAIRGAPPETRAPSVKPGGWEDLLYRERKPGKGKPPDAERVAIRLIPYYAWANRGASHMTVWLPLAP